MNTCRITLAGLLMLALVGCASSSSSSPNTQKGPPKPGPVKTTVKGAAQVSDPSAGTRARDSVAAGGLNDIDDPCAERLHALAGPLLFYYALHHKTPERVEELADVAGPDPEVQFTCPASGKAYIYNPKGLPRGGGKPGLLVLYDPEPSHSGMRWALAVEQQKNAQQPLITHVIAEPETTFAP
jgi:hypothetical protein